MTEGYYILGKSEDAVFLLYILFYEELVNHVSYDNNGFLEYSKVLNILKKDPDRSAFIYKMADAIDSGDLKIKSGDKEILLTIKMEPLSFFDWASMRLDLAEIAKGSVRETIKEREKEVRIASFKDDSIDKKQFESLVKKEPLWSLYRATLYVSGYKGFDDREHNSDCVKSDSELDRIYKYALDSNKINELYLIGNDSALYSEGYQVRPQEFARWAKLRSVESPFLYEVNAEIKNHHLNKKDNSYVTPDMQLMFDAVDEFWSGYNLQDPNHHAAPVKSAVVSWLTEEAKNRNMNFSKTRAEHMDTIIRCPISRKGGNTF